MVDRHERILLTGASGYVGGRLLRPLAERGAPLRCLARRPEHLAGRVPDGVEVVRGDVLDRSSLDAALAGVSTAFYLVHSMGDDGSFAQRESEGARNFAAAARAAGVRRIVYLGGLFDERDQLSPHLASRREVGQILRSSGAQTIELRASIVIGSGSLSFEMIRALVERLPVMITPRWVAVESQPIAIDDLLAYLLAVLDLPPGASCVFEVGGADRVSYGDLMRAYAELRGLRRRMIRVPVLTPRLSSLWLGLVTPLYARVGRKLVESIRHPTVVRDLSALKAFPIRPTGVRAALEKALADEDREIAATRWCDAVSASLAGGSRAGPADPVASRRLVDARSRHVDASPREVFRAVERIGGRNGWYAWNSLWRLRGWIDLLLGGVGMRRQRPDADRLRAGDVLDCWRVESVEPGRRLRLAAEMKLPGRAWLEFEVEPDGTGARLRQTALFDPIGWSGYLYWYGIWPLHRAVFDGLCRGIADAALGRVAS